MVTFYSRAEETRRAILLNAIFATYRKYGLAHTLRAFNNIIQNKDFSSITRENNSRFNLKNLSIDEIKQTIENLAKESLKNYEQEHSHKKQTPLASFFYEGKQFFPSEKEFYDAAITEAVSHVIENLTISQKSKTLHSPRPIVSNRPELASNNVRNISGKPPKDLYVLSDFHRNA